jgi:Co/Zn/Cd efflux system component
LLVAVGVTLGLHLVLLAGQITAAALTGSIAIAANALHIGVDTAVHGVALGGVWLATRPADPRHPYGYERYEALASLLIGMLLLVAMALIVSSALPRLVEPQPGEATAIGVAIMAVSAVSTAGLASYLRRRARQMHSRVLGSEAIHAAADALVSLGVLAAVVGGIAGLPRLDPIMALTVGGVVAWRGWGVVRGAAEVLRCGGGRHWPSAAAGRARRAHTPSARGWNSARRHPHPIAPELTIVEGHRIAGGRWERGWTRIAEVLVHLPIRPSRPRAAAHRAGGWKRIGRVHRVTVGIMDGRVDAESRRDPDSAKGLAHSHDGHTNDPEEPFAICR